MLEEGEEREVSVVEERENPGDRCEVPFGAVGVD